MRMLCWPARSPLRASRRLLGGMRRMSKEVAASTRLSFRWHGKEGRLEIGCVVHARVSRSPCRRSLRSREKPSHAPVDGASESLNFRTTHDRQKREKRWLSAERHLSRQFNRLLRFQSADLPLQHLPLPGGDPRDHRLVLFKRSPGLQSVFTSTPARTEVPDYISKRHLPLSGNYPPCQRQRSHAYLHRRTNSRCL